MRADGGSRGVNPSGDINWTIINPERPGEGMENRILKPIQATICDKTDSGSGIRALARVTDLQYVGETVYGVLSLNPGISLSDLTDNNIRLMLYVNHSVSASDEWRFNTTLAGQTDGIGGITFTKFGTAEQVDAIPAWGVISVDNPAIAKGKCLNFGTVALLRAMAKVRVQFNLPADQAAVTSFNSVSIYHFATSGNYVPQDWWHRWQTADTRHDAMNGTGGTNAEASYSASSNVVEFYLPECANPTAAGEIGMRLSYTVSGENRTADIYFREYDSNGHITDKVYNIVRNNYYHYEVTSVSMDKIQLTAYVNDWAWRGNLGSEIRF